MRYTDDPAADYDAWDAEQERRLARLPRCVDCGEPIQDEMPFHFHGDWYCESCMDSYREAVMIDD